MGASNTDQFSRIMRVALEPIYNVLNSFSLLNMVERQSGLNSWIVQTAARLTPDQRHANKLVFEGLRDALVPRQETQDFRTYLFQIAMQGSEVLRDRVLERLRSRFTRNMVGKEATIVPERTPLLTDLQAYLACVEYRQRDVTFDAALQREVHELLNDPSAMQRLIIDHLTDLWQTSAASEWNRVQRALRSQVAMFTRSLDERASVEETVYSFTGRELSPALTERLARSGEIIFVPSWHTGRHMTLWEEDERSRLFFSTPPNYDVGLLQATPVGQAELRARLGALADETRLRILDLLLQEDEMHAQEIIVRLGLSQSSVSRHLKQLVSLGYLYERRGEGANKTYRLSPFYFARTAHALVQLVAGEPAANGTGMEIQEERESQELRRFLDREGRLTLWPPARQRDKLLILEYLASFFESGQVYSEKEVNEQLLKQSTFKDSATLRRALQEYRFMNRTRDGSKYWLNGSDIQEQE